MSPEHIQAVAAAFGVRQTVARWLREDLHPMDREDGQWFLDAVTAGEDPRIYFQSAIPYLDYLTDEARVHFLPEIMSTLVEYPVSIFVIASQIGGDAGERLVGQLTKAQSDAVAAFLDALALDDDAGVYGREIHALRSVFT